MTISAKRMAVLREHIRAESVHDIDALLGGMTPDCFNDVVGAPEPFVGPVQTTERYRKHWEGFPDFTVRVRRILSADESCIVTENEWRGTHLGTFMGWPATGKPVRMRAIISRATRCGARRSFSIKARRPLRPNVPGRMRPDGNGTRTAPIHALSAR